MIKQALRTLFKTPFVTMIAIVSLGLGIGANGAIFSLFDQMILRELPVPQPQRLINLSAPGPKPGSQTCSNAGGCDEVFSYLMFRDLEDALGRVVTGVAAHRDFGANLAFEGQTETGGGILVSGSYFGVLGLAPALGRLIGHGDDEAVGASNVVVLAHDYWRDRFGADEDVLDRTIVVNGQPLSVIGVAPEGFRGTTLGTRPNVFVPITLHAQMSPGWEGFDNRRSYWAYLFARLRPGVDRTQAHAAIDAFYRGLLSEVEAPLQEGMSEATMTRFLAKPILVSSGARGQSTVRREARAPLTLLFSVAGIVLLIACANIANLLLARAAARGGEIAVRLSVGASRRRLIAQLLVESCTLAALGAAAGLLFARWTLVLIGRIMPPEAIPTLRLSLDFQILGFAAALALGTGLLFGLFPAYHATRVDLVSTLKGQAGQPAGARSAARFRAGLVTAQIALSTALLVAAGLFTKSLLNVSRVDLGIDAENVATFVIAPELNGYTPDRSRALFARVEEELAAIPGVSQVTTGMVGVLAGSSWGTDVRVDGFEDGPDVDDNSRLNVIGTDYFRALGIPLISGREFTVADTLESSKVAIVNEAFARKFGLGSDVVGRRMGMSSELDMEIVGWVKDAKYNDVKGEIPPLFFTPYRQDEEIGYIHFYVRASGPLEPVMAAIPGVLAALDPNLPVEELRTLPQQIRDNVFIDRVLTVLSASFAIIATLLAAIGLYGVLAYTVAQRTREFGLRMVLGADGRRVRQLVLGQVGRMTLVGAAVGLVAAIAIGYFARSQLYELEGYDPAVLVISVVILCAVALGSGLLPAIKAARIEPMRALRYE